MAEAKQTTDHGKIRTWAEERGGRPSKVETQKPGGILRIDFGEKEEAFTEIDWDEFFSIFERSQLAFLYQEQTDDGKTSRFNKFIDR